LLRVLSGKILEQTILELEQEEEIRNIRNAKSIFLARLMKEKDDIRQLEEKENEKKNNFENFKKIKRLDKYSKISTQQKLMSRVFSINYLKNLKNCTINLLKPTFKDYKTIAFKDNYNRIIYEQIDNKLKTEENLKNAIINMNKSILSNNKKTHTDIVMNRKQLFIQQKEEAEKKRIADEEKKKLEKEQQAERRKKRAIFRLERDLQNYIFNQSNVKGPYHIEDIGEINNMYGEPAYGNMF
jgi:hypothetical protein